jgi:hypothetical protein
MRCTMWHALGVDIAKRSVTIASFRGDMRIAVDSGYGRMELDADALLILAWNGNGRANSDRTLYCLRAPQRFGKNGAHTDTDEGSDR